MRNLGLILLTLSALLGGLAFLGSQPGGHSAALADTLPVRARILQVAADSPPGAPTPTATATPTRTATRSAPSATATSTPTRSPSPTATVSQPTGVYSHHSIWYVSQYTGTIHVEGLVTNGLGTPIGFTEITADFYSADGQLLATDFGFSELDTVPAGGTSPYTILLLDPPDGIASVSVRVTDYDTTPFEPPATGLTATVTNIYRSITGTVHVVGTVKNNSAFTYEYVEPIGAFLDSQGYMIRTDYTFASPDTLPPGAQGTFDMLFLDAPTGMESANFMIWVDGNR